VVLRYHLKLHPRQKFTGIKMQILRREHLDAVYRWAEEIAPSVARSVAFQLLMTPRALGLIRPGIEVIAPVLADSWKEAKNALRFLDDSPIRRLATFTTPLMPMRISIMSMVANITHFPPGVRWCADNMWVGVPVDELLPGLEAYALGIQLADENLGRRPARFMADAKLRKLDGIRQKYNPQGLFRDWMGRHDKGSE